MSVIVKVKENVCKTEGYVDNEIFDETVRYLNRYLESSGRMDLKTYKSIVNRKMGFQIPYDSKYDSLYGFIPSEKYEIFYSEMVSWFDNEGNITENTGELKYRTI